MIKTNMHKCPNFRYWNDGSELSTETGASAIILLKYDLVFVI